MLTREESARESIRQHFIQHKFPTVLVDALYLGYCNNINVARCAHEWLIRHPIKPEACSWIKIFASQVGKILSHPNYSQGNITKKLCSVYAKYFPHATNVITGLRSKGACNGLAIFVSYALMLDLSQMRTKVSGVFQPRDDWTWLRARFDFFARWDETSDLSPERIADAVYLVSVINSIHNINEHLPSVNQGDCAEFLRDTRKRSLALRYSIGSLFTRQETQNLVVDKIFWQKKKVILGQDSIQDAQFALVSSHFHDTSVIQRYLNFHYYDANNITGPLAVAKENISFLIFVANFFLDVPSPLGFRLYGVDKDRQAQYPSQAEILQQTHVIRNKKFNDFNNYCHALTAIDAANFVGSRESVRYLFSLGARLYSPNHWLRLKTVDSFLAIPTFLFYHNAMGDYPIHQAVRNDHILILEKILQKDKRVTQFINLAGSTALHIAVERQNIAAIHLLLLYEADITLKNSAGKTALQLAEQQADGLYFPKIKNNDWGQKALIDACRKNDFCRVKFLLLTGVDPMTQSLTGLVVSKVTSSVAIKDLLSNASKKQLRVSHLSKFKKAKPVMTIDRVEQGKVKKLRAQ